MKKTVDKITDSTSWFLGSWWAVILHTIWFSIWLIFNFSIDTLTLYVSLEAIFIGIFLLMSANRAEIQRDRLQAKEQAKVLTELETDVNIDERQEAKLNQILKKLTQLEQEMRKLKAK